MRSSRHKQPSCDAMARYFIYACSDAGTCFALLYLDNHVVYFMNIELYFGARVTVSQAQLSFLERTSIQPLDKPASIEQGYAQLHVLLVHRQDTSSKRRAELSPFEVHACTSQQLANELIACTRNRRGLLNSRAKLWLVNAQCIFCLLSRLRLHIPPGLVRQ